MAYTGTQLFNMSIAIIDEISDSGTIVEAQVKEYKSRAPYLLDLWQHEMIPIENLTDVEPYANLTDELVVSERGCASAPYYLAMHFAASDQNTELQVSCQYMYEKLKREAKLPSDETDITDAYDIGL